MAVQQKMFALEDAETVADVTKVREAILKRTPERRALSQAVYENERKFEIAYLRMGGLLTQGPDPTGYGSTIVGLGDWRDMELMVEAGLTPLEAIQVATLNGAVSLGRDNTIGSIAVGKNAELMFIDGNPAADINDVEKVETVFKDGIGYDSAKIFASVKGVVGGRPRARLRALAGGVAGRSPRIAAPNFPAVLKRSGALRERLAHAIVAATRLLNARERQGASGQTGGLPLE